MKTGRGLQTKLGLLQLKVLILPQFRFLTMWRLGFFFHEMAFGLLSVFLPLYIVAIGGTLVDIGILTSTALFFAIPASFFWGYVCDKTRRYKRYILLSFLSASILLYMFTLTINIGLLIILYVIMSTLHVAHEAPKNVLIAELYSREEWEKSYAFYEGYTEAGWLIGLLLGFLTSTFGFGANFTLLLCSGLNLVAFLLSVVLVADPILIFERRLVSIEKTIDFTYRGVGVAARVLDGQSFDGKLKKENLPALCGGLIIFSLASSIFFTPLPIFLSKNLALSTSAVFMIYVLNSGGGVFGYFFAGTRQMPSEEKMQVRRIAFFRGMLVLSLIIFAQMAVYASLFTTIILILMGFAYSLFLVFTLSLSMELIPAGKSGLFNVLASVGGACGSFLGPFLAQTFGFTYHFLAAAAVFFVAYLTFRIFS